jgi:hypothetical protein
MYRTDGRAGIIQRSIWRVCAPILFYQEKSKESLCEVLVINLLVIISYVADTVEQICRRTTRYGATGRYRSGIDPARLFRGSPSPLNLLHGAWNELPLTTDGNYVIPQLRPGTYTLTIEAQGFKSATTSELLLGVG